MQTCVRNERGQAIGRVEGDRLLLTRRRSRHWLRLVGGWAIDLNAVQQAVALGARLVEIRDRETNVVYRAPLETLLEQGTVIDLGHSLQIALAERHWEKSDTMQLRLLEV